MTVYRDKGCVTYRYDFWYRGQRHKGTTHQTTLEEARAVEVEIKGKVRRQHGGILRPSDTPLFAEWAGVYDKYAVLTLRAPRHVQQILPVILRFWGRRPGPNSSRTTDPNAPYHNLRLADPIETPEWIERFETWVEDRGVGAQTRNHYFSILSRMYRTAMLPRYRKHTGVTVNPFLGIPKQRTRPRQVTLTVEQIRAWIGCASYHVRLTAAIAALAPKLRVSNILALEWSHIDPAYRFITVHEHKTSGHTGRPLVAPISAQLKRILEDAKERRTHQRFVVTYQGKPIKKIHIGVMNAFREAGIAAGLKTPGGATFHTIRHSMSTLLAELDETEAARQALMGHESPTTTKKYTHLRPVRELPAAEMLSAAVPIEDLVTVARRRAVRTPGEQSGGRRRRTSENASNSGANSRVAKTSI